MPIPATLPVITASPGDTIVGQKNIFGFLETAGIQKNFRCKEISFTRGVDKIERKIPDADGSLITDRVVITGKKISFKVTLDEFTADTMIFFNSAQKVGSGRFWMKDPDDAANTAALISNEFACTVYLDGDVSFKPDAFSEFSLTVEITGAFTLTRDGATT